MSDIPIQGTIALDHCWVCTSTAGLHEHHIVPQSCGGTHGPTVTLCAACHSVIHTEAYHPLHARRFTGTVPEKRKLAYLADVIARSFAAVVGSPKPVLKSFKLGVDHQRMWSAFRATQPGCTSDQKAMERAIELLYQQCVVPLKRR